VLVDVVKTVKPRRASLVPDETAATSSAMEPCSCSCCSAIILPHTHTHTHHGRSVFRDESYHQRFRVHAQIV